MRRSVNVTGLFVLLCLPAAWAAELPSEAVQRAFYLEVHEGDFVAAVAAYEAALTDKSMSQPLRREAEARLARCREEVLVPELAQLAPADALAFVECRGDRLAEIAQALGLALKPSAEDGPTQRPIRIEDGLFLNEGFGVSPALLKELSKIRAVTVAITRIDERTGPHGVVVVDAGQSDLLRGLLETGVQFLLPDTPIEGYKTYRVENEAWIATTHRFIIAARSREQLRASLGRLANPDADSLAKNAEFQRVRSAHNDALIFAYVGGDTLRQTFDSVVRPEIGREAAVVRSLLDLDAWQSVCLAVGVTKDEVRVDAELKLLEGHHNLVYGLLQTPKLTGTSLEKLPAGAAAIVSLGLNRSEDAVSPSDETEAYLPSVLDVGREIFDNVQEASLFVLPLEHGGATEIPVDVGIVLAVKDARRSMAIWEAIVKLAEPGIGPPRETKLGDRNAKIMHLADGLTLGFAQLDYGTIVVGTEGAIAAAVRAASTGEAIFSDSVMSAVLSSPDMEGNKLAVLQVGRLLQIAAAAEKGNDADELAALSRVLNDLTVSLVTDERANSLTIRVRATGLPQVDDIISEFVKGRR